MPMPKQPEEALIDQLTKLAEQRSDNLSTVAVNSDQSINTHQNINDSDLSRIIEMAWEDRTPFEAIEYQFKLSEQAVIDLMRTHLHPKSFRLWRKRVTGRSTKHNILRPEGVIRAYCPTQYKHR